MKFAATNIQGLLPQSVMGNEMGTSQCPTAASATEEMFSLFLGREMGHWRNLTHGQNMSGPSSAFQLECRFTDAIRPKVRQGEKPELRIDWVEALRERLLAGGIPLQKLVVSGSGFPVLRKLLSGQGMSEGDIEKLLAGLSEGGDKREIQIPELLSRLATLVEEASKKAENLALPGSVAPRLETILRAFGLNASQTGEIIARSKGKDGALNLERLRKGLSTTCSLMSQDDKTQTVKGDANLAIVLSKITGSDLSEPMPKGPVSLEKFVQILDDRIADSRSFGLSADQIEKETKRLLDHIFVKGRGENVKSEAMSRTDYAHRMFGFQKSQTGQPRGDHATDGEGRMRMNASSVSGGANRLTRQKGLSNLAERSPNLQPEKVSHVSILEETKGVMNRTLSEHRMEKVNVEGLDPGTKLTGRPAVSVSTVKLGVESVPLHVVNQVGRRISLALKRGENHLKIRLKPPELGSIQLEMSMKENALRLAMVAEHQSVKEVLMSHISDLKQTLMQQGIELEKVNVEIDYNFSQSMANARKDLKGTPSRRGGSISRSKSPDQEPGLEEITQIRSGMMHDDSLLDLFA